MSKENGFFQEFKKFITRGSVVDLAVGVVIGGAFGTITTSLVNDVIMPCVGLLLGGVDFSSMQLVLKAATDTTEEVAIRYGMFINAVVNFLIISFAIFIFVRAFNKLRESLERQKEEEKAAASPEPPKKSNEEILLEEIRDILKEKK